MSKFLTRLDESPMFYSQLAELEEEDEDIRERVILLHKVCEGYRDAVRDETMATNDFLSTVHCLFGDGREINLSRQNSSGSNLSSSSGSGLESKGSLGHDSLSRFNNNSISNSMLKPKLGGPVISKFMDALEELAGYQGMLESQMDLQLCTRLKEWASHELRDVKESKKRFFKVGSEYEAVTHKYLSKARNQTNDETNSPKNIAFMNNLNALKTQYEQSRTALISSLNRVEGQKKFMLLEAIVLHMHALMSYHKRCYDSLVQNEANMRDVIEQTRMMKEASDDEHTDLMEKLAASMMTTPMFAGDLKSSNGKEDADLRRTKSANQLGPDDTNLSGPQQTSADSRQLEMDVEKQMIATASGAATVTVLKQGYLQKRSTSVVGDWKRRFFILDSRGTLYYYRSKWGQGINHTGAHDTFSLLTSSVKPIPADETGRNFCFKIMSAQHSQPLLLQADSDEGRESWFVMIQAVISGLLNNQDCAMQMLDSQDMRLSFFDAGPGAPRQAPINYEDSSATSSMSSPSRDAIQVHEPALSLCNVIGNDKCVDCGAENPDWASLNLGALMCIECSGFHRRLGVHLSKVRSLTLDVKIWEPSVISLFTEMGNETVNKIFEQNIENGIKPVHDSPLTVKEDYIGKKYSDRRYINTGEVYNPQMWLWQAVQRCKLAEILRAFLLGADALLPLSQQILGHISKIKTPYRINSSEQSNRNRNLAAGCTILHRACELEAAGMVELIVQNCHQSLSATDASGNSALHSCILMGNEKIAKLLIRRGAKVSLTNSNGESPFDLAVSSGKIRDDELLGLLTETITSD